MRIRLVFVFVLGLGLAISAAAAVGAEPATIPQDAAWIEARARQRLEWNQKTLCGAYDAVGKNDPRWDRPARQALDLAARVFSPPAEPVVDLADVHRAARSAVEAGCDDPLILYLYARSSVGKFAPERAESARRMRAAASALAVSAYPPIRRAVAQRAAAELDAWDKDLAPDARLKVPRALDAVVDLVAASVADDPRGDDWEESWFRTLNSVIAAHRRLSEDYKAAFDRVDARLARVEGIETLRLLVRGNFLIEWGWEARSQAFAPLVTQEQFRLFEARLQDARVALNQAWTLRPETPNVANLMLRIEKGIGGGDRQAMETWFRRALTTDGNDHDACWQKLDWLDPKWYGGDSWDDLLAFGTACAGSKNWQAGITLLAAEAHYRYGNSLEPEARTAYLRTPAVWSEITSVYDEYLAHVRDDPVARSKYAVLCALASHFPEAHAQFQAVGDRLTEWSTFPRIPLETMKQIRDATARFVAETPGR